MARRRFLVPRLQAQEALAATESVNVLSRLDSLVRAARRLYPSSMADASDAPDVFELDSGSFVVFLHPGGVLIHHESSGWRFHPAGSVVWDSLHQAVYRNHRATRSSLKDLQERGIAVPPIAEHKDEPAIDWRNNFAAEMALDRAPPKVRAMLREGAISVYLLMLEDTYETHHGDGRFVYPAAAFRSAEDAQRERERREREEPDPAKRTWYQYAVKPVHIAATAGRLVADLGLKDHEHVTVEDVVRLLNESQPGA